MINKNKPKAKAKITLLIEPLIDEGYGEIGQKSTLSFNIFDWIDIVFIHNFLEKFVGDNMGISNEK